MEDTKKYCSYDKYSVIYDTAAHRFYIFYGKQLIVDEAYAEGIYRNGNKIACPADFQVCDASYAREKCRDSAALTLSFSNEAEAPSFTLKFHVGNSGVRIEEWTLGNLSVKIAGKVFAGDTDDVFPVCLNRRAGDLRSAIGAPAAKIDNSLYNRISDTAVTIGKSQQTRLYRGNGGFYFEAMLSDTEGRSYADVDVKENVLADKYHIKFSPVNRNTVFKTPPSGWMTWYAVKFDACEKNVLENAAWQAKHLKDFGADCVWVDWEWYHNEFNRERDDGVNSLCADPEKYPNGMKYVADKIKEMGLIPAIWIGFTNEPAKNRYIEQYPDMVVSDELSWCGKYFYDFSNPHYLNEYLPEAVGQVHEWGYEAVKYDTLPIAITQHEKHHGNMYDSAMTSKEAFRSMTARVRELLGENMYMLSCAGSTNAEILWASDIFDAARIGDDIFDWEEYLKNCIDKVMMFYPLHNIQLYNDPDNVILREEFNTFEQAKSRAAFVSLLGLPMTFGDVFAELPEDRVNIIKRSLPVLDIHPMDLCNAAFDKRNLDINLSIDKKYESWQVSGIFNMTDKESTRSVSLSEDLHLDSGEYLVYDFYRDKFMGIISDFVTLDFLPYECRILALRRYRGVPQIVSTSRHITQGAAELENVFMDKDTMHIEAALAAGDRYTVSIFVPEDYKVCGSCGFDEKSGDGRIVRLSVVPHETCKIRLSVSFEKTIG